MDADNAFIGRNYFEGDLHMPVPPAYFLQRLYDYDALLVLFPSTTRPGCYVVARRREHGTGLHSDALAQVANPDTRLCMAMGWVPVCMMTQAGSNWYPGQLIARLEARDLRVHGGADKVADMLETQEEAEKQATRTAIRNDLWERSGDGWRTYQARTGASSIQFNGEIPSSFVARKLDTTPVSEATVSTASTPRSTAGLGADSSATIGGEVQ